MLIIEHKYEVVYTHLHLLVKKDFAILKIT